MVAKQLQNTSKRDFFPYPRTVFAAGRGEGNEEHCGVAAQKPLSFLPHVTAKVMEKGPGLYCAPLANSQLFHTVTAISFFLHVCKYCSRQEKTLYFKYSSDKQQNFPVKFWCFKEDSCAAKGHNMRGLLMMIHKCSPPSKDRYALSVVINENNFNFCTIPSVHIL